MSKQDNSVSSGFMIPFGFLFLAAGLFGTLQGYWRYFERSCGQNWEKVSCRIELVELHPAGRSGSGLKIQAAYSYHFNGQEYHGDRVSFMYNEGTEESQRIHDELSQYLPGKQPPAAAFHCYVNPADPASSVLYPERGGWMNFSYVILAWSFPAVGAGLMLSGYRGLKRGIAFSAAKAKHPEQPWLWSPDWTTNSIPEINPLFTTKIYLFTLWSGFMLLLMALLGWLNDALLEGLIPWLIFLGAWCIPARMAWVRLRHRKKVGSIHFIPSEIPSCVGQHLSGIFKLEKTIPAGGHAHVRMICTTPPENAGKRSDKVVDETLTIPILEPTNRIPASFQIPPDAPQTILSDMSSNQPTWTLWLALPNTSVITKFEVPVFNCLEVL